ncbi:Protein LTV1-like protein [Aphelenchoides fujianensis]|nr:Protein LTV1-like protein [Aphelenchoides fujianensis]
MGKKKKFFIDKHEPQTTYRLVSAVEEAEKRKFAPNAAVVNVTEVTPDELAEREKWGIYFSDNYNYLSHLKAKDESTEQDGVQTTQIAVPQSAVQQPTTIVERNGLEFLLDGGKKAKSAVKFADQPPAVDVEEGIDPEILAALELDGEFDGDEGDFPDDFCAQAGGFELPEGRRIFEEIRKTAEVGDSSDEEEDDEEMAGGRNLRSSEHAGDATRSILKPAPANPDKKELDERFEQFYEHMDESGDEEEDEAYGGGDGRVPDGAYEEAEEDEEEIDEQFLGNMAEVYEAEKEEIKYEKPDPESKLLSLTAFARQEAEGDAETEKIEVAVRSKRARWDCESIVSTYSNLYNHPTVIREEPKRKTAGLTKKDLRQLNEESAEMEVDVVSTRTGRSVCTVRSRGETAEERRERKAAVKAERRERREERKANKTAFKEEKKKMDAQRGHVWVSGRPMK